MSEQTIAQLVVVFWVTSGAWFYSITRGDHIIVRIVSAVFGPIVAAGLLGLLGTVAVIMLKVISLALGIA
jgi:hypothetical protein